MSELLQEAARRQERADAERRPIDYARMQRVYPKQKAALTRAVKSGDPSKLAATIRAAVEEWDAIGAWPDDWSRWQRALDDVLGWNQHVDIRYL